MNKGQRLLEQYAPFLSYAYLSSAYSSLKIFACASFLFHACSLYCKRSTRKALAAKKARFPCRACCCHCKRSTRLVLEKKHKPALLRLLEGAFLKRRRRRSRAPQTKNCHPKKALPVRRRLSTTCACCCHCKRSTRSSASRLHACKAA